MLGRQKPTPPSDTHLHLTDLIGLEFRGAVVVDDANATHKLQGRAGIRRQARVTSQKKEGTEKLPSSTPVSYTHLTLPTKA